MLQKGVTGYLVGTDHSLSRKLAGAIPLGYNFASTISRSTSPMRQLAVFVLFGSLISSVAIADNFVKVEGKINGKDVLFDCEGKSVVTNFMPQTNPKVAVNVSCMKGANSTGVSFAYPWSEDPKTAAIPAFDGTKVLGDYAKYLTFKVALGKEFVEVHSFKNDGDRVRQHYKTPPTLTITDFKKETKNGAVYYTYTGSTSGDFEAKSIGTNKMGGEGSVKISFQFEVKCSTPPGAKHTCS